MTITGEWWNQSSRPILKSQGGVTQDVASCDIPADTIPSGKLTSAARYQSVAILVDPRYAASSSEGVMAGSTSWVTWRPRVNVNVLNVSHVVTGLSAGAGPLPSWQNATCDNLTLYGNAGTCIGGVDLKAGTTNPAAYTRTCSGALTQVALAAGTNLLIQRLSSTCSVQGRSSFQIDYESTG